jgi:glycosyltransferase involved in cell wall biosynthesis
MFLKEIFIPGSTYGMNDFWQYIESNPDSYIIYHFCDGWENIDSFLCNNAKNAIVRWHNNTPPWFYVNENIDFADGCNRGFEIIARMAKSGSVRFIVNSEFTRRQLHALDGLDSHIDTVFPGSSFLLKDRATDKASCSLVRSSDAIELLFVGRVVPHKGHRHILSVAAIVQRFSGKRVRISFVGAIEARMEGYRSELTDAAIRLSLDVIFTGLVSDQELSELYQSCDAFICMSEHEGFGMPVFEAMRSHVPIVAWASSAMSDLLEGHPFASGEFDTHRFAACVLASLDPSVRQRVVAFQETVLRQYTRENVQNQLLNAIAHARGEDTPELTVLGGRSEGHLDDIVIFVTSLAEWMEQEVGKGLKHLNTMPQSITWGSMTSPFISG